ncbi:MAG: hypothetical protein M0C28_34455 [Candidatus Moduliflexus flocculans]|nr:hypothetical protein [Candidatus Moduliflexus flocculans]
MAGGMAGHGHPAQGIPLSLVLFTIAVVGGGLLHTPRSRPGSANQFRKPDRGDLSPS